MPTTSPSLFARDDTFLGVCEGLGQDFGFHPDILRVTLAVLIFFSPVLVIGSYLVVGLAVAAARWAFPARSSADSDATATQGAALPEMRHPGNDAASTPVTAIAA